MDNIAKPYNSTLSFVRALEADTNNVVMGYYFVNDAGKFIYDFAQATTLPIKINPYTVCRNSGIKDKNEKFVFEYDLLKLTHGMKNTRYGFLVWDEFYKSWKIRCRTDRTAYNNFEDWIIEVIGNIVLYNQDAEIIYKQEKQDDSKESFIDNSYCSSKFRR
ncbi:MAG: YopX family protein [Clostridia bacterium]|nr:YopX family protein [Clostridia bacterium]